MTTASIDRNAAVVVLPAAGAGRLADRALKRWLSRSTLTRLPRPVDLFGRVLEAIGAVQPRQGLAALRLWGQTGDRPSAWLAGADPVHMEARIDHLRLHALAPSELSAAEAAALFDHLQHRIGPGSGRGFASIGCSGYLSSDSSFASAALPAGELDGMPPDEFMPDGEGAAEWRRRVSEIEMALHGHAVNSGREARGMKPVNSLWLWGGGEAPWPETVPHPPLFADDALLCGYWLSVEGAASPWPGSIEACLEQSVSGFVAALPPDGDGLLEPSLRELRDALHAGRIERLVLLFRDRVAAEVRRYDRFRLWRRGSFH